jgi:hypothetical protein
MTSELSFMFSMSIGEDAQKMWKALRDTFARIVKRYAISTGRGGEN